MLVLVNIGFQEDMLPHNQLESGYLLAHEKEEKIVISGDQRAWHL